MLGESSYAIYLTHLTAMFFVVEFSAWKGLGLKEWPLLTVLITVTVAVIFGIAMHFFVERPVLRALRGAIRPLDKARYATS